MRALAIVGTDIHRVPLDELGALAARRPEPLAAARAARALLAPADCVALLTCNRVELVVATAAPRSAEELRDAFARAFGPPLAASALAVHHEEAAQRHLIRVACSLESAVLGESQILGQVRDAFAAARAAGLAGARLAKAFDLALRVGRRVRRETRLPELGGDLARLALRHLKPGADQAAPIALLGTGAMARALLAARSKHDSSRWLVVGRDGRRAARLAREFRAAFESLDSFLSSTAPLSALVAATRSISPIVPAGLVRARLAPGAPVVDLGLPRNVDPEARSHVRLADLADLRATARAHRAELAETIARIERWVDEALARRRRQDALVGAGDAAAGAAP